MKRLCIYYVLRTMISKPSDWPCVYRTSCSCITLPVVDELADTLLHNVFVPSNFYNWLQLLAQIQGYESADFELAEELPLVDKVIDS